MMENDRISWIDALSDYGHNLRNSR
jgi:hypothetical protein